MPKRKRQIEIRRGCERCHAQERTWVGTEGNKFWKDRNRWKGLNNVQSHKGGNVKGVRRFICSSMCWFNHTYFKPIIIHSPPPHFHWDVIETIIHSILAANKFQGPAAMSPYNMRAWRPVECNPFKCHIVCYSAWERYSQQSAFMCRMPRKWCYVVCCTRIHTSLKNRRFNFFIANNGILNIM